MVENRNPLLEVLPAARGQGIEAAGRTTARDVPLGYDAVILLELPKRLVQSGGLDLGVGYGEFMQLAGQFVAVRMPLLRSRKSRMGSTNRYRLPMSQVEGRSFRCRRPLRKGICISFGNKLSYISF